MLTPDGSALISDNIELNPGMFVGTALTCESNELTSPDGTTMSTFGIAPEGTPPLT
jgi:hypothetical protein